MNWTHKVTFKHFTENLEYYIDVNNPNVCEDVATGKQYTDSVEGGWVRWWKNSSKVTWEELDFSLENE